MPKKDCDNAPFGAPETVACETNHDTLMVLAGLSIETADTKTKLADLTEELAKVNADIAVVENAIIEKLEQYDYTASNLYTLKGVNIMLYNTLSPYYKLLNILRAKKQKIIDEIALYSKPTH